MLSEAKKREKVANAVLGLAFAAGAAQSPQDFVKTGKIESPGAALMQMYARKRGEAERNLDHGAVVPRNRKMKTFKEFVEEAHLIEMRKEDKVKGKGKTPLDVSKTYKTVDRAPEGSGKKWERRDITVKRRNPEAHIGRVIQGMEKNYHLHGMGPSAGYVRHPHGGGGETGTAGISRGVKRTQTIQKRRERSSEEGRTPAQKVADKRAKAAYTGYDYKRQF
jgi:hypothetical protein